MTLVLLLTFAVLLILDVPVAILQEVLMDSESFPRFLPYVKVNTPVVPAVLQNSAGIVGAAMAATGQL